jgi:O-succinylhomoserine sulfhydrylase
MSSPESGVPSVRKPKPLPDGVSQATIGVRGGLMRSGFQETAEAMYLTSGYVYSSAGEAEKAFTGDIDRYVYSRYGNPTISMLEERLRLIEGAEACFATASGMAAVFTSLGALLGAGDRLVAARSLFGSCFVVCDEILPRWGVETVFVDGEDLSQWGRRCRSRRRRSSSRPRRTPCSRWSTSRRCARCRTPRAQK